MNIQLGKDKFSTRKLHPTFSLEISGLDLRDELGADTVSELKRLSAQFKLLVFKGQSLSAFQLNSFASRFGDTNQPPPSATLDKQASKSRQHNVSRLGALSEDGKSAAKPVGYNALARFWHTDSSWRAVPTWLSFLTAVELPDEGGDTCFADMEAAYGALSEQRKTLLEGKNMIHSWVTLSRYEPTATSLGEDAPPPATHPIVRTVNDRRSLFLSGHAAYYVGNMPFPEGEALYGELMSHATASSFVYQHKWSRGDLLVWDNRTTMHRVLPYDWTQRRVMHRAEVVGSEAPQ